MNEARLVNQNLYRRIYLFSFIKLTTEAHGLVGFPIPHFPLIRRSCRINETIHTLTTDDAQSLPLPYQPTKYHWEWMIGIQPETFYPLDMIHVPLFLTILHIKLLIYAVK
jgi:hypothetical protein